MQLQVSLFIIKRHRMGKIGVLRYEVYKGLEESPFSW